VSGLFTSPWRAGRLCLVAVGAALWTAPAAHAEGWESVEVYSGFDFSSGDYGETVSTDILYIPLTVKYETGPWTLRGTTSYVHVRGPANVIGTGDNTAFIGNAGAVGSFSRSGVGDLLLGVTYSLESFWKRSLYVDLTAKVKLPTASARKALGTGKTDFILQADIAKALGRFTPFGTIAYRFIGRPSAYRLHNAWNASAGLQYRLARGFDIGASYDYRQSALPGGVDPKEVFTYVAFGLGKEWSLDVYGVAGLSSGSADAAGGIQISFRPR
jgi:opacity protein-like surface antigen